MQNDSQHMQLDYGTATAAPVKTLSQNVKTLYDLSVIGPGPDRFGDKVDGVPLKSPTASNKLCLIFESHSQLAKHWDSGLVTDSTYQPKAPTILQTGVLRTRTIHHPPLVLVPHWNSLHTKRVFIVVDEYILIQI